MTLTNKPVAQPDVYLSVPAGNVSVTFGGWANVELGRYDDLDDDISESGGLSGLDLAELNPYAEYGTAGLDVPLSPSVSVYYDLDKIDGAYVEANVSHSLAAGKNPSIDLGALAGFSAGQDCEGSILADTCTNRFNFEDNGLTHVDLSAGATFAAGALSFTPQLHLVLNADDATKVTTPTEIDKDVKLWGGVMVSWSRAFGAEAEEQEE